VIDRMTCARQEMYINAALRKLERESGGASPVRANNIAEARQKLQELKRKAKS
jgi:hypothetical protein